MATNPQFDIGKMIAEENDPKLRVLLLLVNAFNENLTDNTTAIQSLGQKFDEHLTNFEQRAAQDDAMKNQGKGAYKISAGVIAFVQVIGMAIWLQASADIRQIHAAIADGKNAVARFEERLKALENRK